MEKKGWEEMDGEKEERLSLHAHTYTFHTYKFCIHATAMSSRGMQTDSNPRTPRSPKWQFTNQEQITKHFKTVCREDKVHTHGSGCGLHYEYLEMVGGVWNL